MLGSNPDMKKKIDRQKIIQNLKQQLYGKERTEVKTSHQLIDNRSDIKVQKSGLDTSASPKVVSLDTTYLKNDLLKIAVLASAAITIQILLFVGTVKRLINF